MSYYFLKSEKFSSSKLCIILHLIPLLTMRIVLLLHIFFLNNYFSFTLHSNSHFQPFKGYDIVLCMQEEYRWIKIVDNVPVMRRRCGKKGKRKHHGKKILSCYGRFYLAFKFSLLLFFFSLLFKILTQTLRIVTV